MSDNYQIKDANAAIQTFKSTDTGGVQTPHHNVDALPWPTTVTAYALTLTNANTQYTQTLPAATKRFEFKCRSLVDIRFAFETGKVATPTDPYQTLKAGTAYDSGSVKMTSPVLYFASATAGVVVEILAWS